MSIYSGFATRDVETSYNRLLSRLISTMQQHILQLAHFSSKYSRLIAKMQQFQQHKYLPPKFSLILQPLEQLMRESLGAKPKTQENSRQISNKLESVKEEEQLPSSRKQLNKYKTDLNMKRNVIRNKKIVQKGYVIGQNSQIFKTKQLRSSSVFSEKQPRLQTEPKGKHMLSRDNIIDFRNKRYSEFTSSNSSRHNNYKIPTQLYCQVRSTSSKPRNLIQALSQAALKDQ